MKFIYPIYKPSLIGNEKKYVDNCIDSTWISSKGKYIKQFEEKFAQYIDINYASSVTNGTVALHLALLSLGIGAGDEVIVPTLTYVASVNAITYTGAVPVFVDSLRKTWQIDPDDVRRKITSRTKSVLVVHLYGHPVDLYSIIQICKNNNLYLIEDCAEAIGSLYEHKHVGTFGDISTFSFYGNKTITTGEGGMVVTDNKTLFERVKQLKDQGMMKNRVYWHDVVGYNYRMTNIAAAIGLAQLERINHIIEKKVKISEWYKKGLKNTDIIVHPESKNVRHSYWMCSILVRHCEQRDKLMRFLAQKGIETRPIFYPIHTMPIYSDGCSRYPTAEDLASRGINLPSYPELTEQDILFITENIKSFFQ